MGMGTGLSLTFGQHWLLGLHIWSRLRGGERDLMAAVFQRLSARLATYLACTFGGSWYAPPEGCFLRYASGNASVLWVMLRAPRVGGQFTACSHTDPLLIVRSLARPSCYHTGIMVRAQRVVNQLRLFAYVFAARCLYVPTLYHRHSSCREWRNSTAINEQLGNAEPWAWPTAETRTGRERGRHLYDPQLI